MKHIPSITAIVFLAISILILPLSQNADSATITPSKKKPKLFASSDPHKNKIHGYYEISVFDEGKWRKAGRLRFGKFFKEKRIEYSRVPNKNGAVKIRLTHKGGGAAHIDSVMFGGSAPELIDGKKGSDLKKVSKTDFDVIDAYNKTVELEFPVAIKGTTLAVTARVEAEVISKEPFKFPVANIYTEIDEDSSFYIYDLGSNKGKLSLKGKTGELDGRKFIFKEKSTPATGHPEGYTYGYVMNDDKNLYAIIDFTADDTMDGDKDYGKVFVKTKDGIKEFKVSEENTIWGQHHFLYNDKVSYQHKYYEFKIPLKEIGVGKDTENVMLAFSAYGTGATLSPNINFGNVNVGSTGLGVLTLDHSAGNFDICTITDATGDPAMFDWSDPDNDCGGLGLPFNTAGAICNFNATFTPTSAGAKATVLSLTYNNTGACGGADITLTVNLDGTGVTAAVVTPLIYYTLTVYQRGAPPAGMGYVYSEPPGIYCPGDGTHVSGEERDSPDTCSATFLEGTEVFLYTVNRNGMVFFRWEGACDGTWRGAPCDLIMDGDRAVYVRFYPLDTNQPPFFDGDGTWLLSPLDGLTDAPTTLQFFWSNLTDPDDNPINYDLLFCDGFESGDCASWSTTVPRLAGQKADRMFAGAGALGGVVLIGFLIGGGMRTRGGRALMLALFFVTAGFTVAACSSSDLPDSGVSESSAPATKSATVTCVSVEEDQQCREVTGLEPNTTYFWKVEASDGEGGITDSDVWSFTTGE